MIDYESEIIIIILFDTNMMLSDQNVPWKKSVKIIFCKNMHKYIGVILFDIKGKLRNNTINRFKIELNFGNFV